MKQFISIVIALALFFSLSACDSNTPPCSYDGVIDYGDAESFESALNNSESVKGKTVRFCAIGYEPNSVLGINCHAGEHLNFILDDEFNIAEGDIVTVLIKEEPTKVFLVGSWKVPCEVLEIEPIRSPETPPSTTSAPTRPSVSIPQVIPTIPPKDDVYYVFGHFEQDGNLNNGSEPIEWIILEESNGRLLLISRYILDYQDFNDTVIAKATSWKNSSLRKWLNDNFYNTAFSASEQSRILSTSVQDYKSDNVLGDVTSDNVFILSKKQAFSYFSSNYARATRATQYANSRKSYPTNAYWLIDSYSSDLYKYLINSDGKNENNPRVNESEGVRPVIWIKE